MLAMFLMNNICDNEGFYLTTFIINTKYHDNFIILGLTESLSNSDSLRGSVIVEY